MGLGKSKDAPVAPKKDRDGKGSKAPSAQPSSSSSVAKQRAAGNGGAAQQSSSNRNDGISDADRATLQLKLQRDKLNAVLRRSQTVLARELEQAKHFLGIGQKDKALYCLKKKKLQEAQMLQVEGMLNNVQHSLDAIDMARIEASVLESLKQGTRTLQDLQKGMSPEEVEKVMDEAFDAIAVSREVSELLNQQLSEPVMSDDELLAELMGPQKAAEGVDVEDTTAALLDSAKLPTAPLPVPTPVEQDEQAEEARERVAA